MNAATRRFRHSLLGLSPAVRLERELATTEGMEVPIDPRTDTYEQAIVAVNAAYGQTAATW
ncbi:hypothetical protein ABZ848_46210 [Streptomyces sp. NPDC047081]|uniref:hypothetical protein n=1 Tax=Streptomyces sp. NPDC047081 TaxID=3154706 RepID=UPI0033DFCCC7